MIRCHASFLRDIGTGTCDIAFIAKKLEGDYPGGIHPATPEGLVLWNVSYDMPFMPLPYEERRLGTIREWEGYHRVMATIYRIFSEPETREP